MSDARAKRVLRESVAAERLLAPPEATPAAITAPSEAPVMPAADPVDETPPAVSEEPVAIPAPTGSGRAADELSAYGDTALAAFTEAQSAAVRGLEAMFGEVSSLARSEFAAAADSATALLGARSFVEAVEIGLGFAQHSFDAMIGCSAKLSDIGVKTTAEASRPILSSLAESWKTVHLG